MSRFARFDRRNYRTVAAREGYAQWAATYEDTVKSDMDLRLLDGIQSVKWNVVGRCPDLGCGTGRTAAWLAGKGVGEIDGVDATPEMLDQARQRGVFASLRVADVCATELSGAHDDLVTTCLVDEHLAELEPLYAEAARLARRGAAYVLVGFHPFFIMATGMPTHFLQSDGQPLAIETHIHLLSDHAKAALAAGWQLAEMREQIVDDRWVETKPSWAAYRDVPISFAWVWRRGAGLDPSTQSGCGTTRVSLLIPKAVALRFTPPSIAVQAALGSSKIQWDPDARHGIAVSSSGLCQSDFQ